MISLSQGLLQNAPRIILGAFFLISSCQEDSTPAPHIPEKPAKSTSPPAHESKEETSEENGEEKSEETSAEPGKEEPRTALSESAPLSEPAPLNKESASQDIRFLSYNLKNYLTMDIIRKGGVREKRPKDPTEIAALIAIITHERPSILGLCEIGTLADLTDLQSRLKDAGIDLPHRIHAGGFDQVRRLAILSAYPILENRSEEILPFQIGDFERHMGRGILSALIDLPSGPTHFIGLHLKSKRPIKDMDQAQIRLNEARLAKAHCDAILAAHPAARLVLYGDINDTRRTPPISTLMGRSNSKTHLSDIFVKDSRGHLWTHYWSYQQQYARFDYVFTSRSLIPEIDMENSYISDHARWEEASDHRPIMVTFKGPAK